MKAGVSVVICCHNSSKRLSETLRHLAAQEVDDGIPWEVVVVDNASTDDTQAVASREWSHSSVELRVVSEPRAGLSHARQCGVNYSQYDIISFIDDDNWVCPQWIQRVYDHFTTHPMTALLGGPSTPVFETAPPDWVAPISGFYALGKQHERDGDITNAPGTLLWGAGLSIRRVAYIELLNDGFTFCCTGRRGRQLMAGEDSELCFALRASGWLIHYDCRLKLQHFIPVSRLTWHYAKRLLGGMGRSSVILNAYSIGLRNHLTETPIIEFVKESWIAQTAKSLKNLIRMYCSAPLLCLFGKEGSETVLLFHRAIGETLGYFALFGSYGDLIRQIRGARWNRNRVFCQTRESNL